jgi:heptosyltransferase-2
MENILIIKTGAAGDVVRTTSLLNVLEGNIYWVTSDENKPLFPEETPGLTIFSLKEAWESLKGMKFSRVMSLEEDIECARLATQINKNLLTGIYLDNERVNYTHDSANWFDMSKASRLGISRANELKKENSFSYQHYIFQMIGKAFNGEKYRVFANGSVKTNNQLIGIEKRAGKLWPDKQWHGYDELAGRLMKKGWQVKIFEQRKNLRDYLNEIAECRHIVSGDTLAMHIALAYKKTCTAIFNCTSPQEIYDYGLLRKAISPLLDKYFYFTSFDKEVVESISVDEVYRTIPLTIE